MLQMEHREYKDNPSYFDLDNVDINFNVLR